MWYNKAQTNLTRQSRKVLYLIRQEPTVFTTHHSDIQWASSTTTSDITIAESIDKNSKFKNLSGETKSTWSINMKP